jgi:2-aminoethylphosphonate-pyruvate transaminase
MAEPRHWILLSPGPAATSERVRRAMLRGDITHRQVEFASLLDGLRAKLRRAAGVDEAWDACVLTGSGTAAVEAAVTTLVPPGGRLLVLNNGVYGERIADMARAHEIEFVEVTRQWTAPFGAADVAVALDRDPTIAAVAVVHHETTVGLLNDLAPIAREVRGRGRILIVDAISSFAMEEVDVAALDAHALVVSSNKGLHGVPGAAFVYLSPEGRALALGAKARTVYLHLGGYLELEARGEVPYTAGVPALYALDEALDELFEQGGVPGRVELYRQRVQWMWRGLERNGLDILVPEASRSHAVTAARLPSGWTFPALDRAMRERGIIVYAAQGPLAETCFRVANMGDIKREEVAAFHAALAEALAMRGSASAEA